MADALHDMTNCYDKPVPDGARRIAWQGVSFCVPSNWEMAVYKSLRHGGTRVELEDEYAVRLESEWIRAGRRLKLKRIMKRYETASKPLTLKSEERNDVKELPEGWHATHFIFKESGADQSGEKLEVVQHDLVTAFYLCPKSSIFCFFLLHFMPEDTEDPVSIVQQLAATFQDHAAQSRAPWELFDIAFRLPRELRLEQTQFDIGVKRMVYFWRSRCYSLWHFSCAEMFLKDGVTADVWATGYLNANGGFPGARFEPDGDGGVTWRRRKPFIFGHRTEIAAWCFQYKIGVQHIEETGQLVVWVYQYRRLDDLRLVP